MDGIEVLIFGIKLTVKPIAFTLNIGSFHWNIYWYGILIALGFVLAVVYAFKTHKRFNLDIDKILDVVIVTVPFSILCARIYYVLFDGVKVESFKDFIGIGSSSGLSGIAIYGAVIGAFLAGGIMCKIRKVNIFDMFDIAAVGFLIGQAIGRWGNFVNQEAFGSLTNSSWWGMESERTIRVMGEGLVHPCFLYESIWCIAGFFVLNYFSKKRKFSGQITLMYATWYGFGRMFIEMLRTDSLMIGPFKVSVIVSFVIFAASLATLIVVDKKKKAMSLGEEYVSVFEEIEEIEEIEEKEETENDETD